MKETRFELLRIDGIIAGGRTRPYQLTNIVTLLGLETQA
jgi:hypothetical protein